MEKNNRDVVKLGRTPLYVRVREHLNRLINEGKYPSGSQLPAENELAVGLGVSRATLREALHALERSGVIRREQGKGTFVSSDKPPKIESRLEYLTSVWQLANRQGRQLSFTNLCIYTEIAGDELASILKIKEGNLVTCVNWCITVDLQPVAYITDYVRADFLTEKDVNKGFNGSVLDIVARVSDTPLSKSEARITAINSNSTLSNKLGIENGEALLVFEEISITLSKLPVEYSRGYFIPKYFNFEVVRRP